MRYPGPPGVGGALLVALTLGWAATAASPAPELPPAHRAVLDNGLVILFNPNPSALTLALGCFHRVSGRVETRETAGLRALAQLAVLDQTDASGKTLEQRAARQALQINVQTTADYLETLISGTGDQLPAALKLLREVISPSRVEASRLVGRRAQLLRQQSGRREFAETLALDTATALLYRQTPLAWPPTGTAAVAGLQPAQIEALWRLRFRPNSAVITLSGPLTWPACLEETRRVLGDLLPRQIPAEPVVTPAALARSVYVYEPWDGETAVLLGAVACPGPEAETFPGLAVLGAVLGSGEGSRLYQSLRRDRGWVYDVSTELVPSRLSGLMAAAASCAPERAGEALLVMQQEVANLRRQPPSPAEVDRAKAFLAGNYLLGYQRNADVAHYLGLFEALTAGKRREHWPDMIAPVRPEAVLQAAGWLNGRMVWVQVGGRRLL